MLDREWYDEVLARRIATLKQYCGWLEGTEKQVAWEKARIKEQAAAVEEWRADMRELFGDA